MLIIYYGLMFDWLQFIEIFQKKKKKKKHKEKCDIHRLGRRTFFSFKIVYAIYSLYNQPSLNFSDIFQFWADNGALFNHTRMQWHFGLSGYLNESMRKMMRWWVQFIWWLKKATFKYYHLCSYSVFGARRPFFFFSVFVFLEKCKTTEKTKDDVIHFDFYTFNFSCLRFAFIAMNIYLLEHPTRIH